MSTYASFVLFQLTIRKMLALETTNILNCFCGGWKRQAFNNHPVVARLMITNLLLRCRNKEICIRFFRCLVVCEHLVACYVYGQEGKVMKLVDCAII